MIRAVYPGSFDPMTYGHLDVIFMDAPYGQGQDQRVLSALAGAPYVDEETLIIIEESLKADFSYAEALGFEVTRQKKYKTNQHVFLRKKEANS